MLTPAPGRDGPFTDLNAAYARRLAEASIDADHERLADMLVDVDQRLIQIHGMNRLLQCAVQVEERASVLAEGGADERTERIARGAVGADANDDNSAIRGHIVQ